MSERVREDYRHQRDQNIAIENSDSGHRAKMAAELTQAVIQPLQISAMGCQAMGARGAQVLASRALDWVRREARVPRALMAGCDSVLLTPFAPDLLYAPMGV